MKPYDPMLEAGKRAAWREYKGDLEHRIVVRCASPGGIYLWFEVRRATEYVRPDEALAWTTEGIATGDRPLAGGTNLRRFLSWLGF